MTRTMAVVSARPPWPSGLPGPMLPTSRSPCASSPYPHRSVRARARAQAPQPPGTRPSFQAPSALPRRYPPRIGDPQLHPDLRPPSLHRRDDRRPTHILLAGRHFIPLRSPEGDEPTESDPRFHRVLARLHRQSGDAVTPALEQLADLLPEQLACRTVDSVDMLYPCGGLRPRGRLVLAAESEGCRMVAPSTSCRPTEYCQWRRCCGFVVAIREGRRDRASWVGRGGSLNGTETAKRESETGAAAANEVAGERSAVDRSQDSTASCGMVKGLGRLGGRIGERDRDGEERPRVAVEEWPRVAVEERGEDGKERVRSGSAAI